MTDTKTGPEPKTSLILDFGNTRDKASVFREDVLVEDFAFEHRLDLSALGQLCDKVKPGAAILSSVTDERPELREWLAERVPFIHLDHNTPVPFENLYSSPETLGRDRIALVAGARMYFPRGPVLAVDAGTCITYDLLDEQDRYYGGGIAPGVHMRLQAMHTFTARLPLVGWNGKEGAALIGRNTEESLLSGALHGAAAEIDGIAARYLEKHPDLRVLLTGGDASILEASMKSRIFAVPQLVAEGLNKILNHNALQRP